MIKVGQQYGAVPSINLSISARMTLLLSFSASQLHISTLGHNGEGPDARVGPLPVGY